jgi:dTDP-4-amino-4,6-dideoxygalactose transaminase
VGLAQLALIDEFIANRQAYCRFYDAALHDLPHIRTFDTDWETVSPSSTSSGSSPVSRERNRLQRHLAERGGRDCIHFLVPIDSATTPRVAEGRLT